jgi:hypothetical protein
MSFDRVAAERQHYLIFRHKSEASIDIVKEKVFE